uniref:Uncharacterized protein n=1 Tax=Rhizophora mucronata TaxID=61149 RepID=A0A2P2NVP4_RHIMU
MAKALRYLGLTILMDMHLYALTNNPNARAVLAFC